MDAELPLVARRLELSAVTEAIESAAAGRGQGVLLTGEPGIGKTRLLREARDAAEDRGLLVLRGRATESAGAYRPLVEAFARPAARFAGHPDLVGVRPTLARLLPGWVAEGAVLAPMADPAAVLAAALILLLQTMAPEGAALILDDLHWTDPDTVSVLASLVDSVDTLPLALILAARGDQSTSSAISQLAAAPSVRTLALRRLTPTEVADAVRDNGHLQLATEQLDQLVTVVDGLPLIMDELVRQLREHGGQAGQLDLSRSTLASAVQLRLGALSSDCRSVLDALSVVTDTDSDLLSAATGLDSERLAAALHAGLGSTLLLPAATPLGVAWRHLLIRGAVRDLLLPLEQQAIARRAADELANRPTSTDGQLRQAARLYELAGQPHQASAQLIRAARLAVTHAALDAAQQDLAHAQALTGDLPHSAHEVLIDRIETLTVAGRAADAYDSGIAALSGIESPDTRRLLIATVRAAYAAGLVPQGRDLLARLERESGTADAHLGILRAHAAYAERRAAAVELARHAALQAQQEGRIDLACEALIIAGMAARRIDTKGAIGILRHAIQLSQQHEISVWQVRANTQLGVIDMMTHSDPTRLRQAGNLATAAGMVGEVAEIDLHIGHTQLTRGGFLAARPAMLRAEAQARQLHLPALRARAYCHLIECYLVSDQPLQETSRPPNAADIEAVVARGTELGEMYPQAYGVKCALGARAWLRGDNQAAIQMIEEDVRHIEDEIKVLPWWGFARLLRVVGGIHPSEAFDRSELTGHHVNWAARALGTAVGQLRTGQPADAELADAEHHLGDAPFWGHLLRTVAAPAAFETGMRTTAERWLREADAFFGAAGERPLQRKVRQTLTAIGGKAPRAGASVPLHLARYGITAREAEILRLVNAGLSNTEIAGQLFISVRTVETHISSLLQKTGAQSRDQLPSALS